MSSTAETRDGTGEQAEAKGLKGLSAARRKAIRGWCMYDWANSSFATSAGSAILPVYFVTLFRDAFGTETSIFGFVLTGSSMWSIGVALSTAIVALTSPVLGVIADRTQIKKTLLWTYTAGGAFFTFLILFSAYSGAAWAWVLGCFIIANIGFAGGTVFYNSLLPNLAPRDLLNDVSSRGFAFGYIGGGLLLAVHLAIILVFRDSDHLDLVTRLTIASVAFWWFGWAIWTFMTGPEPDIRNPVKGLTVQKAARMAFAELGRTFREITRFRILVLYLLAYLLFNDGIQTVLSVAGAFGSDILGITLGFNMATILLVQFVAAPGALVFSWIAGRTNTKRALSLALAGGCLVIALAVGFAPLEPGEHGDFDYQLEYTTAGVYDIVERPDLSDDRDSDDEWLERYGHLFERTTLSTSGAGELAEAVASSEHSRFGISVKDGLMDGVTEIGPLHPSVLEGGPVDWWPRAVRRVLWEPVGFPVGAQWLLLGALVGIVMGGSQALARSLFAYMMPESRSAEFFGFFGFISRTSAVLGPMVYIVFTGVYDSRMAILMVLFLILAGALVLRWVNVEEGLAVAAEEDRRARAG